MNDEPFGLLLVITTAASVATLFFLMLNLWIGAPPIHCRYLVPVASAPGVYACSQNSRPKAKP